MIHTFPRTFAAGQPLPPELTGALLAADAARPIVLPPLTPNAYLALRREAAGFRTPALLAGALARHADEVAIYLDLIHQLEAPGARAKLHETLDRLQSVVSFDPDVYRQLATEPADRHPRVCRTCGASAWDDANACGDCTDRAREQAA